MSGLRFERCDPDQSPASALLTEMRDELNALYANPARLDVPSVSADDLRGPTGVYLVGYDGADAVAGGGLRHLDDEVAEIKRMYVRPAARSRGIAAQLLASLETEAAALGYRSVRLDTGPKQVHAIRLYRGAGFTEIEDYNDNPFACYWAEKALA